MVILTQDLLNFKSELVVADLDIGEINTVWGAYEVDPVLWLLSKNNGSSCHILLNMLIHNSYVYLFWLVELPCHERFEQDAVATISIIFLLVEHKSISLK